MTHNAFELPFYLLSAANMREHWAKKARRIGQERKAGYFIAAQAGAKIPATIRLTRIAPRKLDDDNLVSAFKAIRDGIASFLRVPDNHDDLAFEYRQERGRAKYYAVRIEVIE